MRKYYVCPACKSENIFLSGYEDGAGDDGEQLSGVYECPDCGNVASEDEAFWGWEVEDDMSWNPDLDDVNGGYY